MEHKVRLLNKEVVAQDTMLFTFSRPADYDFLAGQYFAVIFPHGEDEEKRSYRHTFSICSAPDEDILQCMTRVRDTEFKQKILQLEENQEIEVADPGGNFVLPEKPGQNLVFLAGGIGITPVRSILRDVVLNDKNFNITVLWSNKTPETTPEYDIFKNEYVDNKKENIELVMTMSGIAEGDQSWKGENGRIDKALVERYVPDITDRTFFVVGSEDFVTDTTSLLTNLGVSYDNIKSDSFAGY